MLKVNRNLLFVVIALVLGVLASMLAVRYVNNEVAARTPIDNTKTVPLVVPTHAVEKGAVLTADDVSERDVPDGFAPADAITPANYQQYLGQPLRAPLAEGVPIPGSAVDLVTDHFSNIINKGDVAYTIQVDDNSSISGLIVPGDHVDLQLLITTDEKSRIVPLLGSVLVLATGRHAKGVQTDGKTEVNYSNLTLELAPGDAQRVAVASKAGDLRVMLRTAGNVDPFGLSVLSQDDLLRLNKPAHKGVSGVEFIIGGKG
jgi:pilus assembly protein CpaB